MKNQEERMMTGHGGVPNVVPTNRFLGRIDLTTVLASASKWADTDVRSQSSSLGLFNEFHTCVLHRADYDRARRHAGRGRSAAEHQGRLLCERRLGSTFGKKQKLLLGGAFDFVVASARNDGTTAVFYDGGQLPKAKADPADVAPNEAGAPRLRCVFVK